MLTVGAHFEDCGMLVREDGGFVLRRDIGGRVRLEVHRTPVDEIEKHVRVTGVVMAEDMIDVEGIAIA